MPVIMNLVVVEGGRVFHWGDCPTLHAAKSRRATTHKKLLATGQHGNLSRHRPEPHVYPIHFPSQIEGLVPCRRCRPREE